MEYARYDLAWRNWLDGIHPMKSEGKDLAWRNLLHVYSMEKSAWQKNLLDICLMEKSASWDLFDKASQWNISNGIRVIKSAWWNLRTVPIHNRPKSYTTAPRAVAGTGCHETWGNFTKATIADSHDSYDSYESYDSRDSYDSYNSYERYSHDSSNSIRRLLRQRQLQQLQQLYESYDSYNHYDSYDSYAGHDSLNSHLKATMAVAAPTITAAPTTMRWLLRLGQLWQL